MASLLEAVSKDLTHLADVGQHAMDEIYISWEESVSRAYERYGIIRDMLEDGTLTRRRKHKSDYLIEAAADVSETLSKIISVPRNIRQTITGDLHRLYEGMMANDD